MLGLQEITRDRPGISCMRKLEVTLMKDAYLANTQRQQGMPSLLLGNQRLGWLVPTVGLLQRKNDPVLSSRAEGNTVCTYARATSLN